MKMIATVAGLLFTGSLLATPLVGGKSAVYKGKGFYKTSKGEKAKYKVWNKFTKVKDGVVKLEGAMKTKDKEYKFSSIMSYQKGGFLKISDSKTNKKIGGGSCFFKGTVCQYKFTTATGETITETSTFSKKGKVIKRIGSMTKKGVDIAWVEKLKYHKKKKGDRKQQQKKQQKKKQQKKQQQRR